MGMAQPAAAASSFDEEFVVLFVHAGRVARRILDDAAAAEDIAAETMARALVRWPAVEGASRAWVAKVAGNLSLDALRKKRPRIELADVPSEEDDAVSRMVLRAALVGLPRRQRQVVALRYLAGLDEREVADALGVSSSSVKTHNRRGLAALRVQLREEVPDVR
jgi:RNA polymerase sigma factor (sigma-70 family)